MTFRGLQGTITKKLKSLETNSREEADFERHLKDFLRNNYNESVLQKIQFSLVYSSKQNKLTIKTNSRPFANDLVLRLGALTQYFLQKNKRINQIVIV